MNLSERKISVSGDHVLRFVGIVILLAVLFHVSFQV